MPSHQSRTGRPVAFRTGKGFGRPWTNERGAATAELVLATPLLLVLIMTIVQLALWLHATHIAQAAASEALSATRVYGGSIASGQAQADEVLAQLGQGPLRNPTATVTRDNAQASVHVKGRVTAVVPFLTVMATGNAAGPVERFVPGGRP